MNHTIELPLSLNLGLSSQREPIQPLVRPDIAKDGFHGRHTVAINDLAPPAIDSSLHPFSRRTGVLQHKGNQTPMPLAIIGRLRVAKAFLLARAMPTVGETPFKHNLDIAVGLWRLPVDPHGLPFRADTGFLAAVESKLTRRNHGLYAF